MGLDLYAGALSRYYAGDWQTVVERWGAGTGVPVSIQGPQESWWSRLRRRFQGNRQGEAGGAILAWRAEVARQFGAGSPEEWDWDESAEGEYLSDKPAWDGYGAVLLAAAYVGQALPTGVPAKDWNEDPRLLQAQASGAGYSNILVPEIWLPVTWDGGPRKIPSPAGREMQAGSVFTLFEELRSLDQRARECDEPSWRGWESADPEESSLASMAGWGYSIWFPVAEFAARRRVPLLLDY